MRSSAYHCGVDVRQLRCFVAVAEELHFGRAAARLHVAGPAVSQTIRSMENELGLRLFNRTNRRVELTDAGGLLLTEARAVLDRFDGAMAAMACLRSGDSGTVRIGVVPALPPQLVPALLARCAAELAGIDVVVTALRSGPAPEEILGHEADIVLVRGEITAPAIKSAVLAREPVGVALPADHPLAAQPAISASDLNGQPLISFARASDPVEYDRLFGALATAGLTELRLVNESHPGAVDASLRLIARGTGLSPKLRSEVDAFGSAAIVWRPLADTALDVTISAAWRADAHAPPVARVLALLTAPETD